MLGWSQEELSKRATARFDREFRTPVPNNLTAIQKALEEGGIEFIPKNGGGVGVRALSFSITYRAKQEIGKADKG